MHQHHHGAMLCAIVSTLVLFLTGFHNQCVDAAIDCSGGGACVVLPDSVPESVAAQRTAPTRGPLQHNGGVSGDSKRDVLWLDAWLYNVEHLLHVVVNESTPVMLVLDSPGGDAKVAAVQKLLQADPSLHSLAPEPQQDLPCSTLPPDMAVAYSTDTANPFVRLGPYLRLREWQGAVLVARRAQERRHEEPSSLPVQVLPLPASWLEAAQAVQAGAGQGGMDEARCTVLQAALQEQLRSSSATLRVQKQRPVRRKCPDLSVYIYPDDGYSTLSAQYNQVLTWLRHSVRITEDPAEACLFVPSFDTTPLAPFLRGSMADFGNGSALLDRLQQLPHWNGGINHVLLDLSDSRSPFFDPGHAILLKSAFDRHHYRPGHDIAFPSLPMNVCANATARREFESRRLLVSFMGTMWGSSLGMYPGGDDLRRRLLTLHNGDDVVVLDRGVASEEGLPPDTYMSLMTGSKFALVPRGGGLHSYRFVEALSAGAIPVVLADDWVLPFSEILRHDQFVIVVPEAQWQSIPARLRALPTRRVRQLHTNVVSVYERLHANSLRTTMQILAQRVMKTQVSAGAAEVEDGDLLG